MRRIENFLVTFLATFLATVLVGSPIRLALGHERPQNLVEHEIDKRPALAGGGRGADCLVVFLLMRPDNVLDRRTVELVAPGAEQRSLPESPGASVAVRERMDELELVVEHAALDQHRVFAVGKPREEVFHERGDIGEQAAPCGLRFQHHPSRLHCSF